MLAFTSRVKLFLLAVVVLAPALAGAQSNWDPLRKDGIHDPKGPAVKDKMLQEPADALSKLVPDNTGNNVRWIQALQKGEINPRASLNVSTEVRVLDQDILLNLKGGMPIVRFPHKQHTLWLDCANCHEHLFKSKAGENKFSMLEILNGQQCGVCHGAVSFPLTECYRCHSVRRDKQGKPIESTAGANESPPEPVDPKLMLQKLRQ